MRETGVIRSLRYGFRVWPFTRGRGWLLRLARLAAGGRAVRFDIGGGVEIEGRLDDWMTLWTFMRAHERDEAFQRSLALAGSAGVVFDVGAHVGIWSLLAARRSPGARIHAFEPVPATVQRLRHHLAINAPTEMVINETAVGDHDGVREFFSLPVRNTGASSFYGRDADAVETRVPVVTLDGYVARKQIDTVDVIKVDVEGAEILVFSGARGLLSATRAPAVFFELHEDLCASCGATGRDVKQFLIDCGYEIFRWRHARFSRVDLDETHRPEDLFALKPHHLALSA